LAAAWKKKYNFLSILYDSHRRSEEPYKSILIRSLASRSRNELLPQSPNKAKKSLVWKDDRRRKRADFHLIFTKHTLRCFYRLYFKYSPQKDLHPNRLTLN